MQAYKTMAYDAVAVSSDDLSAGADFFQQPNADTFHFVAANVYDKNAKLLFSPHRIKNIGTLTLGIIGLTGGTTNSGEDFVIGDWRKALRDEIATLEKTCTMLVVLSNLNDHENGELQRDFSQIDIIVTADKKGTNIQPHRSQSSLLVQSGSRGKYIGRLDITRLGEGSWSTTPPDSLEQYQNRLRSIDQQLSHLGKPEEGTNAEVSQKRARLQATRQMCLDQIAKLKTAQLEGKNRPGKIYQSLSLPVQPMTSADTVGLIVQDIMKNIEINRNNSL